MKNEGSETLKVEKIYSACLDMDNEDFEMLSLHGSWEENATSSRVRSVTENSSFPPEKVNPAIRSTRSWQW